MISIGLDLSYRRTGISVIKGGSGPKAQDIASVKTYSVKTSTGQSIFSRISFIKEEIEKLIKSLHRNDSRFELKDESTIIVVEGVSLTYASGVMMSGLNTTIITMLYESFPSIPILIVPPTSLKMYVGVKAREGKKPIIARAKAELGHRINSDESDAYFLSKIGLEFLKDCLKINGISKEALHILYQVVKNKKGIFKGLAHRQDEYLILPRGSNQFLEEKIERTIARRVEERRGQIR